LVTNIFRGHQDVVTTFALEHEKDNLWVAAKNTIYGWNITGRIVSKRIKLKADVYDMSLQKAEGVNVIVAALNDSRIVQINAETGKVFKSVSLEFTPDLVAFSDDYVYVSQGGMTKVFGCSLRNEDQVRAVELNVDKEVLSVHYDPLSKEVYVGATRGFLLRFDQSGKLLDILKEQNGGIVLIDSNANNLLLGDLSGQVLVLSKENFRPVQQLYPHGSENPLTTVSIYDDGFYYTGSSLTQISVVNITSGRINRLSGRMNWYVAPSPIHGKGVYVSAETPNGSFIDIGIGRKEDITAFGSKLNHSKKPNCQLILNNSTMMYEVYAIADIPARTECVIDYNDTPSFIRKPNASWKK
jgi:hypothetical protein